MKTVQTTNYMFISVPLFNDSISNSNILNEKIHKSPFNISAEAWENRKLNISHLQSFDSIIWFHHHDINKPENKFDTHGTQDHLLDQPATNIIEIWDLERDWIEHVMNGYVNEEKISLKNEESALYTSLINQQQTWDLNMMRRPCFILIKDLWATHLQ